MSEQRSQSNETNNPYVGPRPFEFADHARFFGRDDEAAALLSLVVSEPIVLFSAESGAGKSSLINTRLVPGLKGKDFFVFPIGRVSDQLSDEKLSEIDNIFVYNLLLSLEDKGDIAKENLALMTLSEYIAQKTEAGLYQDEESLTDKDSTDNESVVQEKEPLVSKVLIIDQFEEILTTNILYWKQRESFFRQLRDALANDSDLWVVLTIREDRAAALAPYLPVFPGGLRARFYMARMERVAALQAIKRPAEKAKRPFADGVAEKLVDNLLQIRGYEQDVRPGQYIEPVQLQVVCFQLWQSLRADNGQREISEADIADYLENIDSALATFYEDAVNSVARQTNLTEITLRHWFDKNLIIDGQARKPVFQGKDKTAKLPNEAVGLLTDKYLLRSRTRAGATWFELNHDRFIEPIVQANSEWFKDQPQAVSAACRWDTEDRVEDLLFSGNRLAEASQTPGLETIDPLVAEFLERSQIVQKRQKARKAGEEAQKSQKQRKRVQRVAAYALLMLIIGILAWVFADVMSRREDDSKQYALIAKEENINLRATAVEDSKIARDQSIAALNAATTATSVQGMSVVAGETAVAAQQTAEVAKGIAESYRLETEAERERASEQLNIAETQSAVANQQFATAQAAEAETASNRRLQQAQLLAFYALNAIRNNNDSELAMLLSLEAAVINQEQGSDPEVQDIIERAMAQVYTNPYFNTTLLGHEGAVHTLRFISRGDQLLSISIEDGTLRIWDLNEENTPQETFSIAAQMPDFEYVSLASDNNTLAVANSSGDIHIWKLNQLAQPVLAFHEEREIKDIALSPDGTTLATITVAPSRNHTMQLWHLNEIDENGQPRFERSSLVSTVTGYYSPIFSPDGRYLYAHSFSEDDLHLVYSWPIRNFQIGGDRHRPRENYAPIAFSTDSQLVAFANKIKAEEFPLGSRDNTNEHILVPSAFKSIIPIDGFTESFAFKSAQTGFVDSEGSVIRVWSIGSRGDLKSVDIENNLFGHQEEISALAYSSNEQLIASADLDGVIRLWGKHQVASVTELLRLETGCALVRRRLTAVEWQRFMPEATVEEYRDTCNEQ